MVRDKVNLFVTAPSLFRCPISLDVMKSPVSLCTGVTYDRSSIQTWLDSGNNTCPATMQILPSKDFVPNHTLHRLIQLWSEPLSRRQGSEPSPAPTTSPEQIRALVHKIEVRSADRSDSLSKIAAFAEASDENRRFLAKIGNFVAVMVGVLCNVDVEVEVLELVAKILNLTVSESIAKDQLQKLIKSNGKSLSSIVSVLRKGCLESKIESAKLLGAIACDAESMRVIAEYDGLLYELLRLLSSDQSDQSSTSVVLSSLITISKTRPVKTELVRFGIVRTLAKIISDSNTGAQVCEKALKLLEMVSTCSEGRTAVCEDPSCVSTVVQRMMKVSSAATEHAVAVVWSVSYLLRDGRAQEAVMNSNGLTKILLLMQSHCSPTVRKMCNDLVKIFRVNSKSCLACYETKTTHIMPY